MRSRLFLVLAAAVVTAGSCAASRRGEPATAPSVIAREVQVAPAVTAPLRTPSLRAPVPAPPAPAPPAAALTIRDEVSEQDDGVMHIVQPGQTLWRIARAYDVSIDAIARANTIDDPTHVDVGVPIFIPGARATIEVAPYPAPLSITRRVPSIVSGDTADLLWPIHGGAFMRPFGEPRRHHTHAGVDIRGARGQDILAARAGTVAFCGHSGGGYGTMVILDHGDGVQTLYAHAQKLLVKTGDKVERGEPIALVGRTGNATTEHCHFELRIDNRPIDPMPHLNAVSQARK